MDGMALGAQLAITTMEREAQGEIPLLVHRLLQVPAVLDLPDGIINVLLRHSDLAGLVLWVDHVEVLRVLQVRDGGRLGWGRRLVQLGMLPLLGARVRIGVAGVDGAGLGGVLPRWAGGGLHGPGDGLLHTPLGLSHLCGLLLECNLLIQVDRLHGLGDVQVVVGVVVGARGRGDGPWGLHTRIRVGTQDGLGGGGGGGGLVPVRGRGGVGLLQGGLGVLGHVVWCLLCLGGRLQWRIGWGIGGVGGCLLGVAKVGHRLLCWHVVIVGCTG
mmetsp:Transcript_145945/g.254796  ORF Transcript_145945/g.254796 Transcript_145945/m.254796 type:complete len:271 (+) Transcript_145945:1659-2471(+)